MCNRAFWGSSLGGCTAFWGSSQSEVGGGLNLRGCLFSPVQQFTCPFGVNILGLEKVQEWHQVPPTWKQTPGLGVLPPPSSSLVSRAERGLSRTGWGGGPQ